MVGPSVQNCDGARSNCESTELSNPPDADSVNVGKNAAISTPICSFAAAALRSAEAMSGRRSRMDDGKSAGTAGGGGSRGGGAKLNVDAGPPQKKPHTGPQLRG